MRVKEQTRKKLPSHKRRAQVLSAARSLFAEQGYTKTTLDDIASEVGISRPRVVQLFGSKLRIYEEIAEIAYRSHPLDKDLEDPIRNKDDFGVFQAFASHVLNHTAKKEDREIFKILMYATLREDSFHRAHFQKKDSLMISRLSDYVRSRIQEGAFKNLDYRTVIHAYQAMISNIAIYKNVLKGMKFTTIEKLSHDCAQIFLEGIAAAPGNRAPREREKG
ncbi:MAG: TetR/AcrR family transcriptional regulator [Desulfatiglans sp.]|jgi:AcrR family transcriptional regulator|nr:TetR/AcrR family transcriptional regulator [Desulfatiglans sp.]